MTAPAVLTIADDVWAVLDAIADLNTYDGEILDGEGRPTSPPNDPDGRCHSYAVYYPAPGRQTLGRLAAVPLNVAWAFQVTCAGGDRTRCLWAVDRVTAAFMGRRFIYADVISGKVTQAADAGPVRRDETVKPSRFYLPLLFALHV